MNIETWGEALEATVGIAVFILVAARVVGLKLSNFFPNTSDIRGKK